MMNHKILAGMDTLGVDIMKRLPHADTLVKDLSAISIDEL
jgi:hypothetical protein